MYECSELVPVQYGSWAGACGNDIACSVLACGSVYRVVPVRESVPQYSPRPPGLCISVYVCTVQTPKDVVQCAGARPPGLCTSVYFSTVRAQTGFVRCEPTRALYCVLVLAHRALYPVLMCSCGFVRPELTRACASVYGTSPTSFARCEPTKALYSVLVLAPQGFAHGAYVLVRSYEQMSSCTRTCTYVRYELTRSLCFCAGGCANELLYGNLYVYTVRAHNGFMQFSFALVLRNEAFTWN